LEELEKKVEKLERNLTETAENLGKATEKIKEKDNVNLVLMSF